MIAQIQGTIEYIQNNYIVVSVNDIGYQIFVTNFTLQKISLKEKIKLYTFTYVREDTLALYGFLKLAEKEMFELLISISGIGPKAALGILSIAEPKTIQTAILNDDVSILTKVSGIGRKTAERVILELKNKIENISIEDSDKESKNIIGNAEAVEALQAMGYTSSEAREALSSIPTDIEDVGMKIKLALQNLGKK